MVIALERTGNLSDGKTGRNASRKASRLKQGTVGMAPGPGILGQFLFRVGIEFLEGYDVGVERSHVFEIFLFALRLFGESIPDVVTQDPEFGIFFISFGEELNGKEAKEKKKEWFHPTDTNGGLSRGQGLVIRTGVESYSWTNLPSLQVARSHSVPFSL